MYKNQFSLDRKCFSPLLIKQLWAIPAVEFCTGGASHGAWDGGGETLSGRNALHQLTRLGKAQDELDLLKRARFLEVRWRLALDHCGARLVLILLLMGCQVFLRVLGKKVSSDPSGNVTDPCEVKWIYVLRRRCYFNRRSALLLRNVDGLS